MEKKEKVELSKDFCWAFTVAIMGMIIWALVCFGSPLSSVCGEEACIKVEAK